jgi:prolyl oligopeptidase
MPVERATEQTMRKLRAMAAAILVLSTGTSVADPGDDFRALLDEAWEWQLENYPMFASQLGDDRYNDRWADQSLAAIEARQSETREFLRRLYAIDRASLSESEQLDYELFRRELQNEVDGFRFKAYLLPFGHQGGIQNLETNTDYLNFAAARDYDGWLARLNAVDELVGQTIALAEEGRKQGYVAPRVLMERIPAQIALQIVDEPEASPYYAVFETMPDSIAADDQARLRAAARAVIAESIVPAYRRLARYFGETYLPACRETIGLSALPDGEAWYEFQARTYTTTRMSPDEIHRLGLAEVRRIRDEMDRVIAEVDFAGDFPAFLEYLRSDAQFYYDDPDELYQAYLATAKRIDPELVKLFGKLPRVPYGVKPIPDSIAPDTTTAYYTRPAADGSRAGIYWVNLYKPEVRPKYEIEVLTVHEAMPGHHLQIALQQELGDLPDFRRYLGFTAFVEGWGLYSENLGYDLGLYKDPYSRFGQLTYEMWRAVRLVVDTGMHYKGWTRQQAIDFFRDNAAKTELDIVNEIDRYIAWPGQALAYKVGQLKMLALRDRAEAALREDFDIRAFHDALLGGGALPLDLLEQRMDAWLTAQRKHAAGASGRD